MGCGFNIEPELETPSQVLWALDEEYLDLGTFFLESLGMCLWTLALRVAGKPVCQVKDCPENVFLLI